MSAETNTKSPSRSKSSQKEKERRTSQSAAMDRLKVVVRRLPPNLPENVFWQSVQPWVTEETATWKVFYPGKFRKRLNKENIPSRAYIAFKSDEQLATFARDYDGHLFRDKTGNESQAVVEFSPYQKVPSEKKKTDARNGTIEKDEDYISFLESLKSTAANPEPPSMEALIAAAQPPAPPKTTPLLEALKAEKTAHRDKEIIQRNHAHYKETVPAPMVPKKEESKKKGSVPPHPKQPEQPQLSKKAAKRAAAVQRAAAAKVVASATPVPSTANPSKSAGSSEPTPIPASKTVVPKAPRAMREQQARQQATKGASPSTVSAQASTDATSSTATAPTFAGPASEMEPPTAATTPRRSRPVIAAASRQFEAALSGAGVTVDPAGVERKSRREREKERERNRERQTGGPSASAKNPVQRGQDKPRAGASEADGSDLAPGAPKPKVTTILQRVDPAPPTILQRDDQNVMNTEDATRVVTSPITGGTPETVPIRGTGRRGRGRGRGGHRGGT